MHAPCAAPALVACPDARPPAYQAVIGLHRAGLLHSFLTGYYHRDRPALAAVGRRLAPGAFGRVDRVLRRRFDPEIPAERVRSAWGYDIAIRLEDRLARNRPGARREVARWRTERFDRAFARRIDREAPGAVMAFSDVGSREAIPLCRQRGIPVVLSIVHGDPREEQELLDREAAASPEFFRLYLGDGALDLGELAWLHDRRLAEREAADLLLVPSEHIASRLRAGGIDADKIRVIPYAADVERFRPDPTKRGDSGCTFLFAGGVCQRKGIRYLLEAWRRIRRPGWRLQLLGALPSQVGPLAPYLDEVELLGRVGHAEMPARMAAADVFVFPSLFEGSAVVTYEALACGLPSVVTPSAGSVVRDGIEGFLVEPGSVEDLAERMERLGNDAELRCAMSAAARSRAEAFGWPRYHAAVAEAVASLGGGAAS